MIGKSEWFQRRKYGGWGISPKTWQGWFYLFLILIPFAVFQALPFWDVRTRLYVTIGWLFFLGFDINHIMLTLKRDEREHKIEALSERNAAWIMALLLIVGTLYQVITSALQQKLVVDWFLIAALFAGMVVKTISNLVYERKPL